ncbi:glycosyltransferase family 4 protein [Streptomyces sp. NPDC057638]|uniref:glycosyltransferase family 4 protein n=1 Tax=Streptomyces sp. NPDC057638 TaxID=3346190 RepID=UPI0036CA8409
MTTILALTDSPARLRHLHPAGRTLHFPVRRLPPAQHTRARFLEQYAALTATHDLASVDVVVAEHAESLPLLHLMRRDGHCRPALMIPHTNPYPLHNLFYALLAAEHPHPGDLALCGSPSAAWAWHHVSGIRAEAVRAPDGARGRKDRGGCRDALGLPKDRTLLLHTGGFLDDGGLEPLLDGVRRLRRADPRVLLVLSMTQIDPPYYNRLAPRLRDVILFHRLEPSRTADLHSAADLYVSGATSVFDTYTSGPMEALARGIPVVVPRWGGAPSYIDDANGGLVAVEYLSRPRANPYEFARMDPEDFAAVCQRVLRRAPSEGRLSDRARQDTATRPLAEFVADLANLANLADRADRADRERVPELTAVAGTGRAVTPPRRSRPLTAERYPDPVRAVLDCYGLKETGDLLDRAGRLGLLDRSCPGEEALLRDLHHDLFGAARVG